MRLRIRYGRFVCVHNSAFIEFSNCFSVPVSSLAKAKIALEDLGVEIETQEVSLIGASLHAADYSGV